MQKTLTFLIILILAGCQMKDTSTNSAFEYIKSSGGIAEYRLLSNGLTVLLMEDHSAPVATFMVTYHVGSRNEAIGHTGATHILEHMMFKGSKDYNREKGTRVAEVLQNLGAQINATTWMDRTNYFELLPSEHLEEGIKVEADRMRNAFIRDEDRQSEMTVVRNEFERGENDPFNALDKQIWATAFQAHPYHHSTIGWRSDIENVSTERLKEFYDTFYWPNNATATVIGDFDTEEVLAMIERHFGQYTSAPHDIPAMYTAEPAQEGPRRLEINRSGQTGIVGIAHKIPDGRSEEMYAIQIMSRILGEGKSSRLYRKLVDAGLAMDMYMWDFAFHDPGLFIAYVFMTPGTDHARVEQIILDEYEALKTDGVTADEVARAKAQIRSDIAFSRDGSYSVASSLNEAIAIGDWTLYTTQLDKYDAVTPAQIREVANKYLIKDHSTTGWFVPETPEQFGLIGGEVHQPQAWRSADAAPAGGGVASVADQITEDDVVDGLTLYTMNNGVQDVVTITGSIPAGDVYSPKDNPMLAELTAAMLDQGTTGRNKAAISEALESVGASISFASTNYYLHFTARCLKDDVPLVIELLAEQLREPAFPVAEFETVQKRLIGELERAGENTRVRARIALAQQLYPQGHPNHRNSITDEIKFVKQVTVNDLKVFHRDYYGLGNMVLVAVGDVKGRALARDVKAAFKDWQVVAADMFVTQSTAKPSQSGIDFVKIPDKTSVDMYLGQAIGIDRDHDDYYPLVMGLYILGGNFSARLMSTVRDQQGLTYGISSGVAGVDNNSDGYWFIWGTFAPDLLETGRAATLEQLKLLLEKGVSAEELANKKNTITGSFQVGLATTTGIARQVLTNAERGRELTYLDEYPDKIRALELDQVNGALKRYIDLDKITYVAAGTLAEE